MKHSRDLAFVTVLLVVIILAVFGNVSASQTRQIASKDNMSFAITPTPTPAISKPTPVPRSPLYPSPVKPSPIQITRQTPRTNTDSRNTQGSRRPTGDWQTIYADDFESGGWPYGLWTQTDLSNDGYDRKWGWSNYYGFGGLWPAAGGTDRIDPPYPYPNYMNTRMIYGPFNLSDAKMIDLYFDLWHDIESCCDYMTFEVSLNANQPNPTFQELGRWTGYEDWAQQVFYLDQYAGNNQVWVAWRFYSDYSVSYAGPWVDNVQIYKYVPGQVTAQGTLSYIDRNNVTSKPGRFTRVYLYDQDPGGVDDLLAITTTDTNGQFWFPTIINWDNDDSDPDPNNRRLDLYVIWESDYNDSATSRRRVTDFGDQNYQWLSYVDTNAPDGIANFSSTIPAGWVTLDAMWLFQDLRRSWEYVRCNTAIDPECNTGIDPGSATAKWQFQQNALGVCGSSCFYAAGSSPYLFIAQRDTISSDSVIHELGHNYMYNATNWWLWWDVGCYQHSIFSSKDVYCAWSEGWADFFPLAVNGDPCFDFDIGPCTGAADVRYYDLELHSRNDTNQQLFPFTDIVEGRVAGALYDIFDSTNGGFDQVAWGFSPVWDVMRLQPIAYSFADFWSNWKNRGYETHLTVQAIYQNSIDYDTIPVFIPPLPDRTVLQNFNWNNAIDLWLFAYDPESNTHQLTYQLVAVTDTRCGISLSPDATYIYTNRYVNIAPQQGWSGSCTATVRVNDGIKTTDGIFTVNVVPIRSRNFLPTIFR